MIIDHDDADHLGHTAHGATLSPWLNHLGNPAGGARARTIRDSTENTSYRLRSSAPRAALRTRSGCRVHVHRRTIDGVTPGIDRSASPVAPVLTLHQAAATVAAYTTAVRLGILDHIDRSPATAAETAAACGISYRGARAVLDTLADRGLVLASEGRFRPAHDGLAAIHPMLSLWERLPETVRTGDPVFRAESVDSAQQFFPRIGSLLASMWTHAVDPIVERLPRARTVLDVGAGSSPWGIALARRDPECRITALDLPGVLPATRRAVESAGLCSQFGFLPGDLFEVPLPERGFDLIVLAQVCHLFDAARAAQAVRLLAAALRPGGTLAVVDSLPGSPGTATQELSLLLQTTAGTVHEPEDQRKWFLSAGLRSDKRVDVHAVPGITLLTATKG
ncbi:class I SAM-dependent methyltransferase [Pseudonocardiaceae bacterium YIM PH 21723]|nr:class I SAM-dependent methyltransferase [Pseudonocardiaceae bacterium YIM PH 21723]